MAQTVRTRERKDLERTVREVAGTLPRSAMAFLGRHPELVRNALLLAAASQKFDAGNEADASTPGRESLSTTLRGEPAVLIHDEEATRRLDERTRPGTASSSLLTTKDVCERTGVQSRQTVLNWLREGRIIGWPQGKRSKRYPAEQFDRKGQPLHGLAGVVEELGNGYATWTWLTTPAASLDGRSPLDLLRAGQVERVARAAAGSSWGDFE